MGAGRWAGAPVSDLPLTGAAAGFVAVLALIRSAWRARIMASVTFADGAGAAEADAFCSVALVVDGAAGSAAVSEAVRATVSQATEKVGAFMLR